MSLWNRKSSAVFIFLFNGNLPDSTITFENWKLSRPEEGGCSVFEHWRWIWIKFCRGVKSSKITQNLYFCFLSVVFFGTRIAGADHGELLALIIPLSSIFSAWVSISYLSSYEVRYWGRLTGGVSPTNISCSMTSVHLKSLVSSSWNTRAHFSRMGSINCLSSCERWSSFPCNSLWYKAFFFCEV